MCVYPIVVVVDGIDFVIVDYVVVGVRMFLVWEGVSREA